MTKAAIEALVNAYLASAQPITAAGQHRPSMQAIIDELYNAQSRGDVLKDVATSGSLNSGDLVFIIRSGSAKLVNVNVINGITDWDMTTNLFPSGSKKGQRYYGTGVTTLVDRNGDVIPSGVIATSLVDNASTSDPTNWALQYTII